MENHDADKKNSDRLRKNCRFLKFILPIAVLAILFVAGIFLFRDKYLTLALIAPNSEAPIGGWYLEEHANRKWTNDNLTYFVWRVRSNAWDDKFASKEEVMTFLADQMMELGWSQHPSPRGICNNHFAEARFLPEGNEGYLGFVPVNADLDSRVPITCVAIIALDQWTGRYEVVVQTINPSFLTVLDGWFR